MEELSLVPLWTPTLRRTDKQSTQLAIPGHYIACSQCSYLPLVQVVCSSDLLITINCSRTLNSILMPKCIGRDYYFKWIAWGATLYSEEEHTVYLLLTRRVTKSRSSWDYSNTVENKAIARWGTKWQGRHTGAVCRSRGAAVSTEDGDTIIHLLCSYPMLRPAQWVVPHGSVPFRSRQYSMLTKAQEEWLFSRVHPIPVWLN